LTKDEILKLKGRELDAAVAEYVMGLKVTYGIIGGSDWAYEGYMYQSYNGQSNPVSGRKTA